MATEPVVTLTRQELYEKVWSTPLRHLGPTYGVSSVHLAKICDDHDVPLPPRGYWRQKAFGKDRPKPSLPACEDPAMENVRISPDWSPTAAERKEEHRITVAEQLTDPHPLVERTVRSLSSAKPDRTGRVRPRAVRCIDVEVSRAQIDRACRILDAIVKAFVARGYEVSIGDEEVPKTWVTVFGERISIRLEEGFAREEKIDSFFADSHEYNSVPNGKLAFRIGDTLCSNHPRKWSDGKAALENKLNTVVAGVTVVAKASKSVREANAQREREREEEARRRQEREQRQRHQEARVQDFEQKLAAWERAEQIRVFVAAVRANANRSGGAIPPDGGLERWVAWALRRADRIDPVVTDRPERRWPPPKGHRVRLPNQGNQWRPDGSNGTPVLPPGAVSQSADGTAEPSDYED